MLGEYVPAPHALQVEAPAASENLPVGQGLQTTRLIAAGMTEYLPGSHGVHSGVSGNSA